MAVTTPRKVLPSTEVQRTKNRRYLGQYELVAELGRGGMGRVYLGRLVGEAGFERLSAIKVMLDHMESEQDAVLMLLDEARIASRIHHPNVVPITDIGVHEGSHYVVMDYVEGCSLSELLRRSRSRLPPRLIIPLMLDALRGLHAAHELRDHDGDLLNLVHRDFSPPNLLIGVDGICRVTDFGVVKARSRLTRTRASIQKGKISYMAPEQITGTRGLDRRVDVWAAGVVLWYALTGQHPFRGDSHATTIHNILEKPILPPSDCGLRPPHCFDDLCYRALTRKKTERFETAQEMADELQKVAIKNDMLAPQSEVIAWMRDLFGDELEKRRKMVRAITNGGQEVAFLSAPVLPHMETASSMRKSGPHQGVRLGEFQVPDCELSDEPTPVTKAPPGTPARTRRPKARKTRNKKRALRAGIALTLGCLVGFAICMALLIALQPQSQAETPQPAPAESPTVEAPPPGDLIPPSGERQLLLGEARDLGPVVGSHSNAESSSPSETTESSGNAEEAVSALAKSSNGSKEPTVEPAKAEDDTTSTPTASRRIRIALRGVPDNATIRLDGTNVGSHVLTLPADGRLHTIQVSAPGHTTWRRALRATRNQALTASLRPIRQETSFRDRRRREARRRSIWNRTPRIQSRSR